MPDLSSPNPVPTPPMSPIPPPARPNPTPHDPSVEPHPSRSSTPIKIVLIVLFAILLGAAAFLIVWPRLSRAPSTTPPAPTSTGTEGGETPPLPTTPTTTPETTVPTSTGTTPTTTSDQPTMIDRGSTDTWFTGDEKMVKDPKTGRLWSIRAIEFGDSRCPTDVVCIWAGERTVTLDVKELLTGRTERIILGTSRQKTTVAIGLTLTLIEIDDGKGGVYAEINVE